MKRMFKIRYKVAGRGYEVARKEDSFEKLANFVKHSCIQDKDILELTIVKE